MNVIEISHNLILNLIIKTVKSVLNQFIVQLLKNEYFSLGFYSSYSTNMISYPFLKYSNIELICLLKEAFKCKFYLKNENGVNK